MRLVLAVLAGIGFSACTASNVEVPLEIKSSGKQAPINWSKSLTKQDPIVFSPFATTDLDITWASGSGSSFSAGGLGKSNEATEQSFKFVMTRDSATTRVPM